MPSVGRPSVAPDIRFRRFFKEGSPDECWEWRGQRHASGYGRFGITERDSVLAHRYAYELLRGTLEDGEQLHHVCENKACVNPSHLLLTSVYEHPQFHRMQACRRGHALTEENTLWDGAHRRCKSCRQEWDRERHAKNRKARNAANRKSYQEHAEERRAYARDRYYQTRGS